MPEVSALIPTYNRGDRVGGAIETVLNQTYDDVEAVVVCDGSTDGTEAVLAEYEDDDRVRVEYNDGNRGISYSFNRAADAATGEYYCILGDDDRWHPEKVERQVELMESLDDDYGLVYTGGVFATDEGRVTQRYEPTRQGDIYPEILGGFDMHPHSSHMIKAREFEAVGGFDESFPRGVDWEMTVRLAKRCEVEYLPEVLVRRTFHGSNISEEPGQLEVGQLMWKKYHDEYVANPAVARTFLVNWYLAKSRVELRNDYDRTAAIRSAGRALYYGRGPNELARLGLALSGPRGLRTAAVTRRVVSRLASALQGGYDEGSGW